MMFLATGIAIKQFVPKDTQKQIEIDFTGIEWNNKHTSSEIPKEPENDELIYSTDKYFMAMAFLAAMRSKDPKTQVGACIINKQNMIVGVGYVVDDA